MRRAARTDDNQTAIVDALRRAGIWVEVIGKPLDLLCVCRGEVFLLECKNPDGKDRITREQAEFMATFPGRFEIARSPEEAVALAVGSEAMK